jgi:Ferritin-like domain
VAEGLLAAYRALPSSRRQVLVRLCRGAGVAAPVIGLLDGSRAALAQSEGTDLSVLYASIGLEHQAIWVYDYGLKRNLFPPGWRAYAVEFRGDHLGHRDTQIAIAEERGGRPPDALDHYSFGRPESGDDLIRQACLVEEAAQDAYLALISQIRTKDYLLAAGFILVDEVRHLTVWRRVLGLRTW